MARPDPEHRVEEIADILSHDLKSPLNVARGNIDLARETGEEEFLETAAAALDRAEELIEEVVYLARTGDFIEELELVDLGERTANAWENVRTQDASLEIVSSSGFMASNRGICHLLENLIENAIIHGGPEVSVRVGELKDGFFVEDDGPGIPEEHRPHVFDRGFSVGSETSGLGLHIVFLIAKAHGWEVTVESSIDGGARFEFSGVEME